MIMTVSYTHLDVYKRQPPRWMPPAKWPSVRPTPPSLCRRVKAAPAISASAASDIRIPARPRCCLWFRCWPPPPKSKEIAMVNLVIVSHSARLGEGVGELARQMLINDGCNWRSPPGSTIPTARSAPIRLKSWRRSNPWPIPITCW